MLSFRCVWSRCMCVFVCMSIFLSISLLLFPISVSFIHSFCLSVCIFLSLCLSVSVSVCGSLSVIVWLCVFFFISVCLSLSVCLSVCLCLSLSLSLCLCVWMSVFVYLSVCLNNSFVRIKHHGLKRYHHKLKTRSSGGPVNHETWKVEETAERNTSKKLRYNCLSISRIVLKTNPKHQLYKYAPPCDSL